MNQSDLFNEIIKLIESGRTVVFSNAHTAIKFNSKVFKSWEKTGLKPLYLGDDNLIYARSGKLKTCLCGMKVGVI